MRRQINKLTKRHSTKAERRFMETLKKFHVPFKAKVYIAGREIDFLVGKHAIEIDGHSQDPEKNITLLQEGYTPVHLRNDETSSLVTAKWLKQLYGRN